MPDSNVPAATPDADARNSAPAGPTPDALHHTLRRREAGFHRVAIHAIHVQQHNLLLARQVQLMQRSLSWRLGLPVRLAGRVVRFARRVLAVLRSPRRLAGALLRRVARLLAREATRGRPPLWRVARWPRLWAPMFREVATPAPQYTLYPLHSPAELTTGGRDVWRILSVRRRHPRKPSAGAAAP